MGGRGREGGVAHRWEVVITAHVVGGLGGQPVGRWLGGHTWRWDVMISEGRGNVNKVADIIYVICRAFYLTLSLDNHCLCRCMKNVL